MAPVREQRRSSAAKSPGVCAARSPTRMTPPSASPWNRSACAPSSAIASTAATSSPGRAAISCASNFSLPRDSSGAMVATFTVPALSPLRKRRNSEPHSSSASKATRSAVPLFWTSSYVTPRPRPATWAPRKPSSSSLCLRQRASTLLVPRTTRANFDHVQASSNVLRPPGSKPTPFPLAAFARPLAARSSASDQEVLTSFPSSRTRGRLRRSCCLYQGNANRSLSVIHSSLTWGSLPESFLVTSARRTSIRTALPEASCSATEGVETRSKGRARNR